MRTWLREAVSVDSISAWDTTAFPILTGNVDKKVAPNEVSIVVLKTGQLEELGASFLTYFDQVRVYLTLRVNRATSVRGSQRAGALERC